MPPAPAPAPAPASAAAAAATAARVSIGGAGTAAAAQPAVEAEEEDDDDDDALGALPADDDSVDTAIAPAGRNTASDSIEVDQEAIAQRVLELLLEKGILQGLQEKVAMLEQHWGKDDVSVRESKERLRGFENRISDLEETSEETGNAFNAKLRVFQDDMEKLRRDIDKCSRGYDILTNKVTEKEVKTKNMEHIAEKDKQMIDAFKNKTSP